MRNSKNGLRAAPRLLMTLVMLALLTVGASAPLVSAADTEDYTAAEIETWLVGKITNATVQMSDATVTLSSSGTEGPYMQVNGITLSVLGVSVGLNPIKFIFAVDPGTTDVLIRAELDLLGVSPAPKIECIATIACLGPGGSLEVTAIDNVVIGASFEPALTQGDLDTVADVINQVIEASELTVSPPDASLTGITVVNSSGEDKLKLTWFDSSETLCTAPYLKGKIDGMTGVLETKATSYLAEGEGNWNVGIAIPGSFLEVDASCSAFGITATLSDANVAFDTLTATVTDATFSIGTATKTATFSAEGEVGCSGGAPSITMSSFLLGPEYSGLQGYVNTDIQDQLLAAIEEAMDDLVASTGLTWPFCPTSITVASGAVWLHGGAGLMEGDTNLDGTTNIIDAMFVAQYVVGLRTFDADQMMAGDTTDEGAVNIVDAMHISQFVVDPYQTANVLFKPLWESPADDGMIDPLNP
ncbi:MAG: dockerin type I repeat-containing protein [Dehalococcoidia bacterium]|jgi:hypothetical protein|nr:dockerin type I repeat-containing protein [Dehalococcoidia bacterium]